MTEYQNCHFSKELKESDLYLLTEFFKVLGNPTRIRILLLLMEQDSCVGDLAEQLGITQSAVSHQLNLLKSNKLVRRRRDGKMIFYTLFNQLTGANQHVGNFPGVTVDRKDGTIRKRLEAVVTDLPGIYSLSPYSSEEIVTRDFLMDTHPDGIINIVDAANMERNLYLTMQLMELGIPLNNIFC